MFSGSQKTLASRVQYRIKHFHFKLSKTFCSFSPGHFVHSYWVRCGVVMIWCLLENFHFPDREKKWWVKSIINSKWKKWSSISWAGLERQLDCSNCSGSKHIWRNSISWYTESIYASVASATIFLQKNTFFWQKIYGISFSKIGGY